MGHSARDSVTLSDGALQGLAPVTKSSDRSMDIEGKLGEIEEVVKGGVEQFTEDVAHSSNLGNN